MLMVTSVYKYRQHIPEDSTHIIKTYLKNISLPNNSDKSTDSMLYWLGCNEIKCAVSTSCMAQRETLTRGAKLIQQQKCTAGDQHESVKITQSDTVINLSTNYHCSHLGNIFESAQQKQEEWLYICSVKNHSNRVAYFFWYIIFSVLYWLICATNTIGYIILCLCKLKVCIGL